MREQHGTMIACPDWNEGIPPLRIREFRRICRSVVENVLSNSRAGFPSTSSFETWHGELFRTFVPLAYYAGAVRQDDPHRPCLGIDVHVGDVPGAPFTEVRARLGALSIRTRQQCTALELHWDRLDREKRVLLVSSLIASALCEFIRIHPFINGNGRISRLLWRSLLHRFGLPSQVRIEPRPIWPYGEVMAAAMRGECEPLVLWILKAIAQAPTLPATS
jgi:fido (protein-threonine AMPylation protein)